MPTHFRERLGAAAERLFYAEGIRAVGVERPLADSGVGRASFYRHFASKDDLVLAMLQGYDQRFREWPMEATAAAGDDPAALFDALATRFVDPGFRGCASIGTTPCTAPPWPTRRRCSAISTRGSPPRDARITPSWPPSSCS
jgi:AcrR family transcriptional regulator